MIGAGGWWLAFILRVPIILASKARISGGVTISDFLLVSIIKDSVLKDQKDNILRKQVLYDSSVKFHDIVDDTVDERDPAPQRDPAPPGICNSVGEGWHDSNS